MTSEKENIDPPKYESCTDTAITSASDSGEAKSCPPDKSTDSVEDKLEEEITEIKIKPFQIALENLSPKQFSCFSFGIPFTKYTYISSEPEAIAHLLFLKAIGQLKYKVENEDLPPLYTDIDKYILFEKEKKWQVFVTNAVRRFIQYVEIHRKLYADVVNETDYFNLDFFKNYQRLENKIGFSRLLPPLDVLMVWHSFMLNPTSFYDTFARNNLLPYAFLPFPLYEIQKAIDHETYEYNPSIEIRHKFESFAPDIAYDVFLSEIVQKQLSVHCPLCSGILCKVPYTNHERNGFADSGFQIKIAPHSCPKLDYSISIVDHSILRSLQCMADLNLAKVMPGIYKMFSPVLKNITKKEINYINVKDFALKGMIKDNSRFFTNGLDVMKVFPELPSDQRHLFRVGTREYLQANLIHLTIDVDSVSDKSSISHFQVIEDLVGCVSRQMRFIEKMNKINWLESPCLLETVKESQTRYVRFFSLLTREKSTFPLIPTLDIDLFWHTHQLSNYCYLKCCLVGAKKSVVDHNDKLPEGMLSENFEKTEKLYKKKYKENYTLCFCEYCVKARARTRIRKSFFLKNLPSKGKEKEEFERYTLYGTGLAHISDHSVISRSLPGTNNSNNRLSKNYGNSEYPWSAYYASYYYGVYVIPPAYPMPSGESCLWDGLAEFSGACGAQGACGTGGVDDGSCVGTCGGGDGGSGCGSCGGCSGGCGGGCGGS